MTISGVRRPSALGQTLAEFSLVLPVLLLIIVSVAEFGLLFKDFMILNHAAREGARTGVAQGSNATADTVLLLAVKNATSTLDRTKIVEVRVFKADANGVQIGNNANVYVWSTGTNDFVLSGSIGWPSILRNDTSNPDRLAVRIQYNHTWVTGQWLSGNFALVDTVVMRVEPRVMA